MSLSSHYIKRSVPDQQVFLLWYELGSIRKVAKFLAKKGIKNPRTGRPFSPRGLWVAAHRYVLEHLDEAWEYYKKDGFRGTKDDYLEMQVEHALSVFHGSKSARFKRWIKNNNLERFSYLYDK